MAELNLKSVRKNYGDVRVLDGIDLDIAAGEFIAFVGPSGCGKSTLLRMIAGLEEITSGELRIDNAVMNDVPASDRGIAMVFQSYALYPHMTVFENIAFGLRIAGMPNAQIKATIENTARILRLDGLRERYPRELSGGQRQRVAIGRAIARNPRVFLFDEPLSNLDASLRVATRIEIGKLKASMPNSTMIYVTHDQVEAMTLADRIVVLNAGRIEQVGTPLELYTRPRNLFVAQFIGSPAMNILPAGLQQEGDNISIRSSSDKKLPLPLTSAEVRYDERIKIGVRPEDLRLADADNALFQGKISMVEHVGEFQLIYLSTDSVDGEVQVIAKLPPDLKVKRDELIALDADVGRIHVFLENGIAL